MSTTTDEGKPLNARNPFRPIETETSILSSTSTQPTQQAIKSHALKSKSLTHLDLLETQNLMLSNVPPQQAAEANHTNCFRVYFDLNTSKKEELLPAVHGATLGHLLGEPLKRRKLSISQLAVYELPGTSDLRTPLTQLRQVNDRTDTGTLAGKYLIITDQDEAKAYHPSLRKVPSFQNDVSRPVRLHSSVSAEEAGEPSQMHDTLKLATAAVKPSKPRWSTLFGPKSPQHQNQLCEILNSYSKNGVPLSKSSCSLESMDYSSSLHYLNNMHGSWREFVNVTNMTEQEIQIQSAIWELVTTEVDYIHALQTVNELFVSCLEAIQLQRILHSIDQSKVFSNIREIYEVNIKFWTLYLHPMVQNSIQTGAKMCINYFKPGFENFALIFSPYKIYCAEHTTCQFYRKELNASNTLFTSYLAWCESQKLCNRLRLEDILVRPTQRLTKYTLLLVAIRKNVLDEGDAESLDCMIACVDEFVTAVNDHLTKRQHKERLKGIMARIESYDVVDTNNENLEKLLKQHCTMFDLCGPMIGCVGERAIFMEGDLRYKDSTTKVDVHCFLLTDMLLICKPIAKKGVSNLKVIRQPFALDRLKIAKKENTLYLIYMSDWDVAVAAFTLQSPEAKNWFESFTKAKHLYARLKFTHENSPVDNLNIRYQSNETLGIRKSPLNSSMGSRLSSLNNSHSGSVELNDSRNISMDYEKPSSLSSDEGMQICATSPVQGSILPPTTRKLLQHTKSAKYKVTSSNTLLIQPFVHLGQSLPNLNMNASQMTNNTLLVPGSGHSNLLSASHRGISYPPPSPQRAMLQRSYAITTSPTNPPLVKSRNVQSQCSVTAYMPIPTIGHSSMKAPTKTQLIQKLSNDSSDS